MSVEPSKKKVLHIIDGFGTGGAETWLLACVKYLHQHQELGLHFDFLASGGKKGLFDDEVIGYGATVFYQKYSLKNIISFRKQFKKILNQNDYVAIHDHQDFISGWHFLAGSGSLPVQRIAHLHNPWNFVTNYVTSLLRCFSFRAGRLLTVLFATKITATSEAVMDEYGYDKWPYVKKRVAAAYCGFEVERFSFNESAKEIICKEFNWDNSVKIVLFVGRIGTNEYDTAVNQKNPEFALTIAKELAKRGDQWKVMFAGFKGKLGEAMEEQMKNQGLCSQIRFLGIRKDIPLLMSAADILLFPSLWEGLGMVAVEAQATGLKVLATDNLPDEAFVIKELVLKKSISSPASDWADIIIQSASESFDRKQCQKRISESNFSISNSISELTKLYNIPIGSQK